MKTKKLVDYLRTQMINYEIYKQLQERAFFKDNSVSITYEEMAEKCKKRIFEVLKIKRSE